MPSNGSTLRTASRYLAAGTAGAAATQGAGCRAVTDRAAGIATAALSTVFYMPLPLAAGYRINSVYSSAKRYGTPVQVNSGIISTLLK